MSQYTPTKKSGVSRLRTGYEKVIAHRTRLPFAYVAEQDGKVLEISDRIGTITIEYKDKEIYVLNWGQEYSNNGGGGFYVTQNVVINGLKEGSRFKKGDVILYNSDFFTADPYSKQVETNLGYHAYVALAEMAHTMDDSCIITRDLAEAMATQPVHVRQLVVKSSTIVHEIVEVGTKVKAATPLMIFDDSAISAEYSDNPDLLDAIKKLNRAIPKAKYNGTIVKIEAFYKTPIENMSESMATVVKSVSRLKEGKSKKASKAVNKSEFPKDAPMNGDRLGIIDFEEDTVVLRFYVQQELSMEGGDKLVFGSSLKSVCAEVKDHDIPTEDGSVKVQGIIAAMSQQNRMVLTPLILGVSNRILEKMEKDMLDIYFE